MDFLNNDDIDPTIAAMLADVNDSKPGYSSYDDGSDSGSMFDFSTDNIGTTAVDLDGNPNAAPHKVDMRREKFLPIEKTHSDEPTGYFDDKTYDNGSYYKTALEGEGPAGQRVNQILKKYLTCQDPKEKSQYRMQIVNAWWELLRVISSKVVDKNLPMAKRMLVRYGVALPSLFTPEQKKLFSTAFFENETGEPVYYLDEWLSEIAKNHIAPSATDEKRVRIESGENGEKQKLLQLKAKNDGRIQAAEGFANSKIAERQSLESELKNRIESICEHEKVIGLDGNITRSYTDAQKSLFSDIFERLRGLQRIDKDLSKFIADLEEAKEIGISLEQKLGNAGEGDSDIDSSLIEDEFSTIRQMAKMACGRRGNPFPMYSREFYHCTPAGTGFREEVIKILREIEMEDRSVFRKKARGITNRIVPFVILIPSYGDFGFCWQPFDRLNRSSSRGRLVIPMYPKNLRVSLLMAVADYRWQYAKERAIDWTDPEDGITGQYYQYIDAKKLKGEIKSYFIADYVTWMTKEINGTQVMEKELRGIFWRNIPFCKETREKPSKRSMVYLDLYRKDDVRMSTFTKEEVREYQKVNSPYDDLNFPGERKPKKL